jgi:hypothetical protein
MVYCQTESQLAPKVLFRRLDAHMTEKQLNLLQFASGDVA